MKLPRPFEYVLNTPSHHRVHHGSNDVYLDKNYGGILIIWDRMFGTFIDEGERVRYGLTKNIRTFNPVTRRLPRVHRDVGRLQAGAAAARPPAACSSRDPGGGRTCRTRPRCAKADSGDTSGHARTMQDAPLSIARLVATAPWPTATSTVKTWTGDGFRTATYAEVGKRAKRARQRAARARHRRRPARRHLPVERPGAPRGLLRGAGHGRRAAHAQRAPVPRAGHLHRQPRRGQGRHLRPVARRAAVARCCESSRPSSTCSSPARTPTCRRWRARAPRCTPTRRCSPTRPRSSSGSRSTRTTPRPCVTRAARPATRRASSTATARSSCTRWPPAWATRWRCRRRSKVLVIVPQFHAMAWGLPYAAMLVGASLVMPERFLQPEPLLKMIEEAKPNFAGAVPTIWQGVLAAARGRATRHLLPEGGASSAGRPARSR